MNVTRLNITNGLDPCVNYTWSVTAFAANGFKTKTVMSILLQVGQYEKMHFLFQLVFQFCFVHVFLVEVEINNDVVHRIGDCYSDGVELFVNFSVSYECIIMNLSLINNHCITGYIITTLSYTRFCLMVKHLRRFLFLQC